MWEQFGVFEAIVIVGFLFVIFRNFRKDKSDGRDFLGGGGRKDDAPTQRK